jgi:hypothetical protein
VLRRQQVDSQNQRRRQAADDHDAAAGERGSTRRDPRCSMEIHFSPDTETRLRDAAIRTGKATAQLVEEAVDRMLEY